MPLCTAELLKGSLYETIASHPKQQSNTRYILLPSLVHHMLVCRDEHTGLGARADPARSGQLGLIYFSCHLCRKHLNIKSKVLFYLIKA